MRSILFEHAYIEPEAGFAQMVDGRVEIHACTQASVMDTDALEIILGLDRSMIRIIPSGVGGGFGAKLDLSVQPFLALATLVMGRPVRLTYTRSALMQSTTKRHPSEIILKIGDSKEGKIQGFDFIGTFNTGAYASWGATVINRVPVHASGPYSIADYRAEAKAIHSHNPPAGAFRGFGVPQTAIAQEVLFDKLAERLGIDALQFRILNALENHVLTVCGQVFMQGAMDIGQGSNTVITQIFATALGIAISDISLIGPDTDVTADAGKTSASRQTYVSGSAARLTGMVLRADILKRVNAPNTAKFTIAEGKITIQDNGQTHVIELSRLDADKDGYVIHAQETYDPPTIPLDKNGQSLPYTQFGYAAQLVVVEVDPALGTTRAIKFVAAHDVGRAINPILVSGQIEGGMALMEEYIPGRSENLHNYLIPTIGDIPPIETIIIEAPDADGPYGAKGLGEHVLIPTTPAILNAIKRAVGVRMRSIPVTPAKLHAALRELSK